MTMDFPSKIMEQLLISNFEGTGFYISHYVTLSNYVETERVEQQF